MLDVGGVQALLYRCCSPSFLVSRNRVRCRSGVRVAEEFIADYDLQTRIRAHAGDMWTDPFPPADVHFYSMIYHDWTPNVAASLLRERVCGPGGHILIHEMLYNDEKTGPFPSRHSMIMHSDGQRGEQYSGKEISKMLREASGKSRWANVQLLQDIVTARKRPDRRLVVIVSLFK